MLARPLKLTPMVRAPAGPAQHVNTRTKTPVVRERNPTTPQAQECVLDLQRRSLPHPADGGDRTHTLLPVLEF